MLTPPVSLSLWCLCIRFPPTVANQLELLETMQCTSLPACLQKWVMSWDNLNHYWDDDADTNGSTDLEDRTSTAYFMCIPEILYLNSYYVDPSTCFIIHWWTYEDTRMSCLKIRYLVYQCLAWRAHKRIRSPFGINSFATGFLTSVYGENGWTDEEMDGSIRVWVDRWMDRQTDWRTDWHEPGNETL